MGSGSCRDPTSIPRSIEVEFEWGIDSVITRIPLGSVVLCNIFSTATYFKEKEEGSRHPFYEFPHPNVPLVELL